MTDCNTADQPTPHDNQIETVIDLLRQTLPLLRDLAHRYEVGGTEVVIGGKTVRSPADVVGFLGPEMADLPQEQLRVVLLDTKNRVLGASLVYQGGLNSIMVRLADCFREAVRMNAAAILLVHNHPSRDPEPSSEDVRVTREAAQVGELLGIDLLDHVIVGGRAFVSLRERGFYKPVGATTGRRRKSNGKGERLAWEAIDA